VTIAVRWAYTIVITVAALAVATVLSPGEPVTVALTLWFLLICPGMALIGVLGIRDPWVRVTAAVALSIALDVAVAGTLVYTGAWSTDIALLVLGVISLAGALLQSTLAPPRRDGSA
jgi:hypothetical protein